MPDKRTIETYCNRYEGLSSLVQGLGIGNISTTDGDELVNKISKIAESIQQTLKKTSSCGALSETDMTTFGILQSEITDINKLSMEICVDSNELMYHLVCAKMPYYMSKVEHSLKSSFVDAASSLYYIERYYLFSSISKLYELEGQRIAGVLSDELVCHYVQECNTKLKHCKMASLLFSFMKKDIDDLKNVSYRRIQSLSDEIGIITRCLFFYFSSNPVSKDEIQLIGTSTSHTLTIRNRLMKESRDERNRTDVYSYAIACWDVLSLIALKKESTFTEVDLLTLLTSLRQAHNETSIVLLFTLSLYGLQLNARCKEFRNTLRSTLRGGVFSILYKNLVSFHTHLEDESFLFIVTTLFYQTVYSYLSVQSSQWHTLVSKQFSLYEEENATPSDGLETIVYLLQYILYKLPGLNIILSGSDLEDNILPYFCTMISDRLRAEPYLFNTYINLLTAIANTSPVSADSVYSFIDKAPSEFVSWPILIGCLNEAEKLLQSDNAQRGLLNQDLTGFICILDLITAVMRNSTACPNIRSNMQVDSIHLFIKLLHQPLHIMLKAKLLSVLSCFARDYSCAMIILSQLECGRILTADNTAGIRYEWLNFETPAGLYPLTTEFIQLLLQLTATCSPSTLIRSSCFPVIIDYVVNHIFIQYDICNGYPLRSGERFKIASLCLQLLSSFLSIFPEVFANQTHPDSKMVLERLCLILSQMLSFNAVMAKVLKTATLQPSHTVLTRSGLVTDCISESSVYIDFELLDAYPIQVELMNYSMVLIRQLLEITPEIICELGIYNQSNQGFINSLSYQLLTDRVTTIAILLNITNMNQPALQFSTLQVLKLLVDQLNNNLFITLFDSYPVEATSIRSSLNQLFIQTLFKHVQDGFSLQVSSSMQWKTKSVQLLLDLLTAHGSQKLPSAISSLLMLPQSFTISHQEGSIGTLFNSLLTFIETPSLVAFHPLASSKIVHFLYLLCSHENKEFITELCSILIDRQAFFKLLSAFPFLLEHATNHYIPQLGGKPTFIAAFKPYHDEERLGVYSLVYYTLSILTILFFQQKRFGIGLQLLSDEVTSMFAYNKKVCAVFLSKEGRVPSTSPLLDTLSLIDQQFAEPANKPVYLNDCVEGCWIQREMKSLKYIQIDLLQLTHTIEAALKKSTTPSLEEIQFFVKEGTSWAYQWNLVMELEVFKSLAFQAGCSLLHINIIENRESISLLPAYATNPLDLYLAVIQALLTIVNRTNTFDRGYICYINSLLIDLFSMLYGTTTVIPAFTQQSILLSLIQGILSPLSQQQQSTQNVPLRSSFYLLLLAFVLYSKKSGSLTMLIPSLHSSLEQFVYLLVTDLNKNHCEMKQTSLSLLNFLLETELKDPCISLLLEHEGELNNLIVLMSTMSTDMLNNSIECRQQIHVVQNIFSLFTKLASTTAGALFLLNHSIFAAMDHSPLLRLNSPPGYPVYPTKLSSMERNQIRLLLKPLFQFVITLVDTVRSFRGLRNEIIQFILSSVNTSFIILEDRDPDELLALEVLALYEAILSLIACNKESLKEELNGFEEVIATKLMELLKNVIEDKKLCEEMKASDQKDASRKIALMKNVVAYSIIYLYNYGETIPSTYLKALGYS